MELEDAVTVSTITYSLVFAVLQAAGVLGTEAYLEVANYPIPPDTPSLFIICPEPPLEEDVRWAAGEWNKAFERYSVPLRMEVAADRCTARVKSSDIPLEGEEGEFGGLVEIPPKEGVITSEIPPEDIRFSMFGEIKVTVWNAEDVRLRRAVILHELGHVILLNHIRDYKGLGPKPVMLTELDTANPPESLTELDAQLAWLTHSFCRDKACGIFYVRIPNALASAIVATAVSAVVALACVVVDFGRVRRQA